MAASRSEEDCLNQDRLNSFSLNRHVGKHVCILFTKKMFPKMVVLNLKHYVSHPSIQILKIKYRIYIDRTI